jgi:hypothetical protein
MDFSTLRSPAEWLALAAALLAEIVHEYTQHGITCDPSLHIMADGGPIPAYRADTGAIYFFMADPTTNEGRMQWFFYQALSGAADLHDVQLTIETYLPLVMAHEVAHHLRFRYNVPMTHAWQEEQIVQLLALTLVATHPRLSLTLDALETVTRRIMQALARLRFQQIQSNPLCQSLLAANRLTSDELAVMSAVAAVRGLSLEALLYQEGWGNAAQLAQGGVNPTEEPAPRYQVDVAAYWLFGAAWTLPHLKHRNWPPLPTLIQQLLLTPDPDQRARYEHEWLHRCQGMLPHAHQR